MPLRRERIGLILGTALFGAMLVIPPPDGLALPAWRLEPLKYTKPGYFSIRVNDQFRVLFQFREGDAYDVQVVDYHGR